MPKQPTPTITEYKNMLTNYRDNLLITFKEIKYDLAMEGFLKFVDEIILCNMYIDYLHAWDKFYNGPSIPYHSDELIKQVETYLGIEARMLNPTEER